MFQGKINMYNASWRPTKVFRAIKIPQYVKFELKVSNNKELPHRDFVSHGLMETTPLVI
jgi:hypothetical protein